MRPAGWGAKRELNGRQRQIRWVSVLWFSCAAVASVVGGCSCTGEVAGPGVSAPPRSIAEIQAERDAIPFRVYFIKQESSGALLSSADVALIEEGAGVADEPWVYNRELYWSAYMCQNSACPKRGEDFAFTKYKPGYSIQTFSEPVLNEKGEMVLDESWFQETGERRVVERELARLVHPPGQGVQLPSDQSFHCPECKNADFITEFLPMELREKKERLIEELQRSRAREGAKRP